MNRFWIICCLILNTTLFAQKKQIDSLLVLGHHYALERTTPYFTGTGELPLRIIKSKHKETGKKIDIQIFYHNGRQFSSFSGAGNTTLENIYTGQERKKYTIYNLVDTIAVNAQNLGGLFKLKSSGKLIDIDQAQCIASNDTCTIIANIANQGSMNSILQKAVEMTASIKPKFVYITTLFYTDKHKNVFLVPIQVCLKTE